MTDKEEDVYLDELERRSRYLVKVDTKYGHDCLMLIGLNYHNRCEVILDCGDFLESHKEWYDNIKLYLYSMDDMTNEEKDMYRQLSTVSKEKFCLRNHIDYNGRIEKGLAIKVTKENNPYKISLSEKIKNDRYDYTKSR